MGLRADACCERCCAPDAGFLHLAGECTEVHAFWVEVVRMIEAMSGLELPLSPRLALLGCVDAVRQFHRQLVGLLLLLAKRRVAMCWSRGRPPRGSDWLRNAPFCQEQLTIFWELTPEGSRPRDIWAPLRSFLDAL
ncbi:hypothetical protein NDU88_003762 [Pleurodeles waltl]|uniref:Uncharacterized protein n=1 Tax=Pleurodeles waltl TaxID=8319 RepID=A0AAV7KZF4_PLEWA|nr:hypothetical protein NDU88_003762 [Pleurodeles waltl]